MIRFLHQMETRKKSETQMGFERTTLRDLVECCNHWATGDLMARKVKCGSLTRTALRGQAGGLLHFAWFCPILGDPNPGIRKNLPMDSGILGFKNQKSVEEIQLPAKDWNPESNFQWQVIRNPRWGGQNPIQSWSTFYGLIYYERNCALVLS